MIIGASAFGLMLTLSGIPEALGQVAQVTGLGLTTYVCLYFLIVVFLGTILDSTSILLVMVPIGLPVVHAMGGDLIWFGIVTVVGVEVGLLTPPLGLSIYALTWPVKAHFVRFFHRCGDPSAEGVCAAAQPSAAGKFL